MSLIRAKYQWVYPRSLAVGDTVLIDGICRRITRINANAIRITVYWQQEGRKGKKERGYTYWVEVGEIRAKKVYLP